MAIITDEAFLMKSGVEYRMEFTPQSRWEGGISAKYKDGARGALRLLVRFEATESSLEISVRGADGAPVPLEKPAEECPARESVPDGARFREPSGIPRVKGEIFCVIPQGDYRVEFRHGSLAGAEGVGEMRFMVTIDKNN